MARVSVTASAQRLAEAVPAARNSLREAFSRIKERNAQRIQESIRKGKVKVIFNSNPVEFKKDSVVLHVNGKTQEIPNDFVWIFAGGEPPTAFLKKIGVGFGAQDLTSTASREAQAATPVCVSSHPSTPDSIQADFLARPAASRHVLISPHWADSACDSGILDGFLLGA